MIEPGRKAKIIHGWVESRGNWVSMEEKIHHVAQQHKKIRDGYVQHQGQWMTIDEKLQLLHPAPPPKEQAPPQPPPQVVNIHQNYNITHNESEHHVHEDKRTFNEHRHVHLDAESVAGSLAARQMQNAALGQDGQYALQDGEASGTPGQLPPGGKRARLANPEKGGQRQLPGPDKEIRQLPPQTGE